MPDATPPHTVFVSHAHADNELCDHYVEALRHCGLDVWYDRTNMQDGHFLSEQISLELERRTAFVVLYTPASLASFWVRLEMQAYLDLLSQDSSRLLLPVRIADCTVPVLMRTLKYIDAMTLGFDAAIDALAVALHAPDVPSTSALASAEDESEDELLTRGDALIAQDRYAEAAPILEWGTQRDPHNFDAWANLGLAYSETGRHLDALAAYKRALALDDTQAWVWNGKGDALLILNRYTEALAAYDCALALKDSDVEIWNGKGKAMLGLKRPQEALAAFERALALDPKLASNWNNLGVALHDLKRFEEALAVYDRALYLDPNLAITWNNKAITLRVLGRTTEAGAAEQRARELGYEDER